MREENDYRALEIASRGTKLVLSISSGVDSQSVLHSFYTQGIPIEYVFYYMPGYNDIEYQQLQLVIKKYGVKIQIIDLDPMKYEEEIMLTAEKHELHPIQLMHVKFASFLPKDVDIIQMTHDPYVHITKEEKFYYYQGYNSPDVSRSRAMELLNRTGRFISYCGTSEFLFSILNDDVYRSVMYTHKYFDENGLQKENFHLNTVDRWDYYIKPIIYGKYWKDELIYFPKYGGWENVPFMLNEPSNPELKVTWGNLYKKKAVLVPYFEFLEALPKTKTGLKYFQRPDD